jgi:ectoine hydroxylase-related dioxygenase (phytanoyl-CoA dioxygenase family)
MTEIQPTISITPEQVEFFHQNGYLAIPAITTPEEVAFVREVYDRLFATRAGRDEGNQFDLAGTDEEGKEAALPQILNPVKYAPELRDTLMRANALHISRQLLGDEATPRGEHAILKPARHGAPTPWHQDEAYWGADLDYESLSVWIPLQPATLENGCMQFVPGTHKWEVQPHHCINNDPRIHGLEIDEAPDESKIAICPLPAGGATFHLSRTMHYTAPNLSDEPRRAYILGFGLNPRPRTQPRDFYWNTQKRTAREERARIAQAQGTAVAKEPGK